ncbi:hypothetical protein HG1285_01171 [Hydrogenivirga sp. 128-5-R1-1]|nr:hypothetical protein HG1285_01171 [Hydrogenivirga sp. 128-5-R1-1]
MQIQRISPSVESVDVVSLNLFVSF